MTAKLVAVCGKGCSGKDFLVAEIMKDPLFFHRFHRVVSATTRPKRKGEEEGSTYYFVDPSFFDEHTMLTDNTFKSNWRYGIPKDELREDMANLAIVNDRELRQLAQNLYDIEVIPIYLDTPIFTIFDRTLSRDNGWEKWRRFFADLHDWKGMEDFITDHFRNRMVLDGSHTSWYNKRLIHKYLVDLFGNS